MEKYLTATEGLLGMLQETLQEGEMERSQIAGEEIWDAIKETAVKYDMNVREMMVAALGCNYVILETALEEVGAFKEQLGVSDEIMNAMEENNK